MITEILLIASVLGNLGMMTYLSQYKTLSSHDPLTGAWNHREFTKDFYSGRYNRSSDGKYIILIDVDNFKYINDFQGHQEGDNILKNLVTHLKSKIRETDKLYRIGGDEFAIITNSINVVERLQNSKGPCSISVGFAEISGQDRQKVFKSADDMMYQNK